ncbi:hypothetical protein T484DRAFT_1943827 [Baffinella frigidus]|nr:hypothetical protein T484DRAFT_1943827 [Cryptophyta sp. CCMP2293]|mmetsp:Transcript_58321/g.137690  ORF Transcript_58321/g.137690 Transcript_58321/m.137690 type:complete len:271 (+) Transcript_58321:381-1193(+)
MVERAVRGLSTEDVHSGGVTGRCIMQGAAGERRAACCVGFPGAWRNALTISLTWESVTPPEASVGLMRPKGRAMHARDGVGKCSCLSDASEDMSAPERATSVDLVHAASFFGAAVRLEDDAPPAPDTVTRNRGFGLCRLLAGSLGATAAAPRLRAPTRSSPPHAATASTAASGAAGLAVVGRPVQIEAARGVPMGVSLPGGRVTMGVPGVSSSGEEGGMGLGKKAVLANARAAALTASTADRTTRWWSSGHRSSGNKAAADEDGSTENSG